jgi:hypothetical protein
MPFSIDINFNYWYELGALNNPLSVALRVIKDYGWIMFVFLLLYFLWLFWYNWRRVNAAKDWTYNFLAVDIPKNNEQSPKAVEYIFSQLAAVYSKGSLIDRYWTVKGHETFGFEIVSDGGYLQFYIWTNSKFKDLVEAAVYAQYPDAIITEVEDYTKDFAKQRFPNEKYEMYGTEMQFTKTDAYPIRTYPMFEHALSQELKDPMAGLLEILSRAKLGEKVWIQLVLKPISDSWTGIGKNLVNKITGKGSAEKGIFDFIPNFFLKILVIIRDAISPSQEVDERKKEEFSVQKLTPGEVDILKAIQSKISKIAFKTVFRIVYLSPTELFDKERVVNGTIGALQQFSILDLNSLKPNKKQTTKIDYFLKRRREDLRKNRILSKYVKRSDEGSKIILNIEELATLYHFPMETVKVPLLSKTQSKRSEPPIGLPVDVPIVLPKEESDKEKGEKKDDFISLLEEIASRKEDVFQSANLPEDLLDEETRKHENTKTMKHENNETPIRQAQGRLQQDEEIKKLRNKEIEEVVDKSGGVEKSKNVKDRGGVPGNLPIGE